MCFALSGDDSTSILGGSVCRPEWGDGGWQYYVVGVENVGRRWGGKLWMFVGESATSERYEKRTDEFR